MISIVLWNVMVKKCVVIMAKPQFRLFLFQQTMKIKNKRIRSVKIGNQALIYLLFISATSKKNFFKNGKKVKWDRLINSLKSMSNIYPNSIHSSTLTDIPWTRRSSRNLIFQEDEYTYFFANDTINTPNYVTK